LKPFLNQRRRGWDLNPRNLAVYTLSKRARSTKLRDLSVSDFSIAGNIIT
jgi:hypothetical protein